VEHARDFVAMTLDLGDWNSKMRVNNRSKLYWQLNDTNHQFDY